MLKTKMNVNNIALFAALFCGSLFCLNTTARAQVFAPEGSYQKTCVDRFGGNFVPFHLEGATLLGACVPKSDDTAMNTDRLVDVFECDGDISNNDGRLKCNRNQNSALMQKAKAFLNEPYRAIFGGDLSQIPYQSGYKIFIRELFNADAADLYHQYYARAFYNGFSDKVVTPKAVEDILFKYLNSPKQADVKAKMIDNAFTDVYGYGVSPKDLAFYNAKKIRYADIVDAERKKLLADKVIHRLAIAAAYQKTMGRVPTVGDFDYWTPRDGTYQEIVNANRKYLYSSKGANDLTETVKRALADKGNYKPSIADINAAIVKYSQKKAIYDEMK